MVLRLRSTFRARLNCRAFGCTVVSTMTFSKLFSVMVPVAFPAVIVAWSNFSTPFSPMRPRQRVIWEGWIGKWCWKNSAPQ
jgi:hypothetical protein